jgi:hypothetical protein
LCDARDDRNEEKIGRILINIMLKHRGDAIKELKGHHTSVLNLVNERSSRSSKEERRKETRLRS